MNDFPLRHISIRVPWHDAGWKGTICNAPHLNGACVKLPRIAELKDEQEELSIAGRSLDELSRDRWPCCVEERAAFMAPFEMLQEKKHALAKIDHNFNHFQPTFMRFPAYSAGVVPFFWLMKNNSENLRDTWGLDVDLAREPVFERHTSWVTDFSNQTALLSGFAATLRHEESICLFYAKHVPFVEGTSRILIGAGRIKDIGELTEFKRNGGGFRGMIWERPIQHSIRPDEIDGFLMPYNDVLQLAAENPALDLESFTAFAPSERWNEFSYCNELVTNDGAISALLSMATALDRTEHELGIATEKQRQWIHDELVRLWKVRGPFPGLGAVLRAFGLSQGLYVAHAIQYLAGENKDPWPLVDTAFREPSAVLAPELQRDIRELSNTWNHLSDERRTYLRLLSRFELSVEQAGYLYDTSTRKRNGWDAPDKEILQNPYRLYEISRHDLDIIHLLTVDRGVFPDDIVRNSHPLEKPMGLDSGVDPRRVRAFSIWTLEEAASRGHTLQTADKVVEAIRSSSAHPECRVTSDVLQASVESMAPEIVGARPDESLALQLNRYREIRDIVRDNVLGRIRGKRHVVDADWAGLLSEKFGSPADEEEKQAQEEKAKALAELAESRFSVLVGPAGTGKTSALGILCSQDEIREGGLLLLAPTGKARVRMQELAGGVDTRALTVAQFLNRNGRYDVKTGRYHLSDRPRATGYDTVIVDEASMLTEDMLGALLDALHGVQRLILVGDPAQLPPIGAGRPFVDIVAQLCPDDLEFRFPRVAKGYAELTIERRQVGVERPDLRLAGWFSATPPAPGDDDVFSVNSDENSTLRFVEWEKPEDFQPKLIDVLVEELRLTNVDDLRGFNRTLGSTQSGEYDYFNRTRRGNDGSATKIEDWQILSPLRGMPFGVGDINRQIHERFRVEFLKLASWYRYRKIPRPVGAEQIVYGDKVINLKNQPARWQQSLPDSWCDSAISQMERSEWWSASGRTKNMKRATKHT